VPKSGHVTITKIKNLHIITRRKFIDSKNAILFDLRQKNEEVIAEKKPFPNSGVTCGRLAVLNLTLVVNYKQVNGFIKCKK